MFKKNQAFTMAETLLVIAIIGVIAALTLPNLSSNTNNKEVVVKVKKISANLNDAYGRSRAKYGTDLATWIRNDTSEADKATRVGKRILEFMNVEKECGVGAGCFSASAPSTISGSAFSASALSANTDMYKAILADGTSIGFTSNAVYFDVDGPSKGFNVYGRDLFTLSIGDRIWTNNTDHGASGAGCKTNDTNSNNSCADWVLFYDNLDYINCDVNATKTTCK